LDARIAALGGGSPGGAGVAGAPRAADAVHDVLAKTKVAIAVGDVADACAASYQSSSANFRLFVNQALIKDARFTSAGRGLYG
jgi:ClpP class serine protease